MTRILTQEGEIPFDVPGAGKPCKTWYKVLGDLSSGNIPLITLHGGPGACHGYLLPLMDLTTKYSIPVVFYDQLGNGNSTHLRDKKGDEAFWTEELFCNELDNLIEALGLRERGFHILGQSWGGMLGSSYATRRPKGLRKLVIANSPASAELWTVASDQLRQELPKDVRETLARCEKEGKTDSKEYQEATVVFYKKHLCRAEPWPAPEVQAALDCLEGDDTVYSTMNGPSEFHLIGSLRSWSIIDKLHMIDVNTLVLNADHDEAQDVCVVPFFKNIPKVKWVTFENASHFSHVEKRKRFMEIVRGFLET